jgi:hypothetical protein
MKVCEVRMVRNAGKEERKKRTNAVEHRRDKPQLRVGNSEDEAVKCAGVLAVVLRSLLVLQASDDNFTLDGRENRSRFGLVGEVRRED